MVLPVVGLERPLRLVKSSELYRNTSTYTNQGCQGPLGDPSSSAHVPESYVAESHLVECQCALFLVDLRGGIESARVLLRRL